MDHKYVAEWFSFADMDLASSEYLQEMHPRPLEIICYHCQQSMEKNLKGYLIYKGVEPPKTHDLVDLNDMCSDIDKRFSSIDKLCGILTRYGVQPRYPQEIEITENDMLNALEYARHVRDFEPLAEVRRETSQSNTVADDKGRHRMYRSEFSDVDYLQDLNVVFVKWKKFCRQDDYRNTLLFAIDVMMKHEDCHYVADTRDGFENEDADTQWVFDVFLTQTAEKTTCKAIFFIIDDDNTLKEELEGQSTELRKHFDVHYCFSLDEVGVLLTQYRQ
jgi:HEPN domain-containing protein